MTVRSGSIAAAAAVLTVHTFTTEHGISACACGWHGNRQLEQRHLATAIVDRLATMRVMRR